MDNATQGWIAGLVAAAVTLAFTAWWESRQHRRRQLDDAVTALANAHLELSYEVVKMTAEGWDASRIGQLTGPVASWQLRIRALAGRRVLGIPARFIAPSRDGLRRSVTARSEAFTTTMTTIALNPPGKLKDVAEFNASLKRVMPLLKASGNEVAICNAWLNNPWRFFPCRDLSEWAESEEGKNNGGFT